MKHGDSGSSPKPYFAMSELDPRLYTVVWIAPLEIEARAALHMFDRRAMPYHEHDGRSRDLTYHDVTGDARRRAPGA